MLGEIGYLITFVHPNSRKKGSFKTYFPPEDSADALRKAKAIAKKHRSIGCTKVKVSECV
jgi:hypothetical protein